MIFKLILIFLVIIQLINATEAAVSVRNTAPIDRNKLKLKFRGLRPRAMSSIGRSYGLHHEKVVDGTTEEDAFKKEVAHRKTKCIEMILTFAQLKITRALLAAAWLPKSSKLRKEEDATDKTLEKKPEIKPKS